MNRSLRVLLRTFISAGLLGTLLYSAEPYALVRSINQINFASVVLCLVVIGVGVWLSAYKWQGFLQVSGIRAGIWKLGRLYLVGIFFNNFLPTSIGGDVVKVSLLCKDCEPPAEIMASVAAERLSGLLAVCLYGMIGVVFVPTLMALVGFPVLILAGMLIVVCSLLCVSRLRSRLWAKLSSWDGNMFESFWRCFAEYCRHPRVLVRAVWTSMVFQLLVSATYYIVARDMQLQIGFDAMLVVVSLVTILTLIPVSLNGIGVREGGFVFFLGYLGIGEAAAITLSLTVYAIVLSFSLLGWIVFFMWKRQGSTA